MSSRNAGDDQRLSHLWVEWADHALFDAARDHAVRYMESVPQRRVYPDEESIRGLEAFDEPLPESPRDAMCILDQLATNGSPGTVAQTGGRYFGFVNGGALPAALATRWLTDSWDQNPALYVISPVVAVIESVTERWVVDLLGLPQNTVAGFLAGSSLATVAGLAAARHHVLRELGWDVNSQGLFGAPRPRVIVSEQAHATVYKALALLGLGRDLAHVVPADQEGRIDADSVPDLDSSSILVLQAGNVNSGAFDNFARLCSKARDAGAWVHIDGAFGLWAAASDRHRELTRGVEMADSWSVDAHKTLNAPYDCGIVLCRHRESLAAAMRATGDYIQFSAERDGMNFVPDMSRRARVVELWATLLSLGRTGVSDLVDRLCSRAQLFASGLRANRFRVLNEVVFNQVLVACETSPQTVSVLSSIQDGGECWCGGTTWRGEPAIRISVSSWSTTEDDVRRSILAFVTARDRS